MAEPKKRLAKRAPDDAPDDPLVAHLAAFFAARPLSLETHLCVALSGGCDSVVLLHALGQLIRRKKILARLSALHVHHGLSPQADAWAIFCQDFCAREAIPLEVVRVSVPRASGAGLEAAARRARYAVFSASPADALLLAHHRDDQAETVLLNLLRGAGVAGAAAMLPERASTHGPRLLRPLLEWPRAHLTAYVKTHDLPWIEDESNDDLHFRRNFLRHEILPKMSEKFASALISPNFAYLHDWCSQRKIHFQDNEDLIHKTEVLAQLQKEVAAINKTLGEHEEIKRFRLVSDEWTPQSGELSPTLKLKRNYVAAKYKTIIDEIYSVSKSQPGGRFRLPKINLNFDINEFIKRLKL